jgi:hypothetical protein
MNVLGKALPAFDALPNEHIQLSTSKFSIYRFLIGIGYAIGNLGRRA